MHNILSYSEKLHSVPKMPAVERWLQFVGVEEVTRDIVGNVLDVETKGVRYRNHCGDEGNCVRLDRLGDYLTRKHGGKVRFQEVEAERWLQEAERVGLPREVGGYLRDLIGRNRGDGRLWVVPKVLKGKTGGRVGWRRKGRL